MRWEPVKRFFHLPGPVLSLTLIGILLLSAVLYYRAVNIQRYLEPALAISTPRMEFAKNIKRLLSKEYGTKKLAGFRLTANSIFVERSYLFKSVHEPDSGATLKKLSRVLLSVLEDPEMRNYVDFILISVRLPAGAGADKQGRLLQQQRAELILRSLYKEAPELERNYRTHFAATAIPANAPQNETDWVEFRFIPTERLHIEVLQSLRKYVH